jgi:hypothetical protein
MRPGPARSRAPLDGALGGWWFPTGGHRETHWAAWQQAIGGSYVILAAVVLLLALRRIQASAGSGHRHLADSSITQDPCFLASTGLDLTRFCRPCP